MIFLYYSCINAQLQDFLCSIQLLSMLVMLMVIFRPIVEIKFLIIRVWNIEGVVVGILEFCVGAVLIWHISKSSQEKITAPFLWDDWRNS